MINIKDDLGLPTEQPDPTTWKIRFPKPSLGAVNLPNSTAVAGASGLLGALLIPVDAKGKQNSMSTGLGKCRH